MDFFLPMPTQYWPRSSSVQRKHAVNLKQFGAKEIHMPFLPYDTMLLGTRSKERESERKTRATVKR